MIINKKIQITLDLLNSNEIFPTNKKELILHKIKEKFINICYEESYILDIVNIDRISCIRHADNRLDGGASVDVLFEARCLVLLPNEVICGPRILETINTNITAVNDNMNVIIRSGKNQTLFKSLQKDQVIPLQVKLVKYNIAKEKLSACAMPFDPSIVEKNIYYELDGDISKEEEKIIMETLDIVHNYKKKIVDKKSKYLKLFIDFLYPYKKEIEFNKVAPVSFSTLDLNIKNIIAAKGIVVCPNEHSKFNIQFYQSNKVYPHSIKVKPISAFLDIISNYLLYFIALENLLDTYTTVEEIKKINSYWLLCNNNKK